MTTVIPFIDNRSLGKRYHKLTVEEREWFVRKLRENAGHNIDIVTLPFVRKIELFEIVMGAAHELAPAPNRPAKLTDFLPVPRLLWKLSPIYGIAVYVIIVAALVTRWFETRIHPIPRHPNTPSK